MRSQSSNQAVQALFWSLQISSTNSLCFWCLSFTQWTEKKKTQSDLHFIYFQLDEKTPYCLKSMRVLKFTAECISPRVITVVFPVARMSQGMALLLVSISSSGSSRFMFLKVLYPSISRRIKWSTFPPENAREREREREREIYYKKLAHTVMEMEAGKSKIFTANPPSFCRTRKSLISQFEQLQARRISISVWRLPGKRLRGRSFLCSIQAFNQLDEAHPH